MLLLAPHKHPEDLELSSPKWTKTENSTLSPSPLEKNYSPFVLEAAAAVCGMDHFNEYQKGKKLILCTDHKPLEK